MAKQKEVLEKCKEFKIKIQKIKKQNISRAAHVQVNFDEFGGFSNFHI